MSTEDTSEIVRYTYRLRPGRQAERALLAEWDRVRWVWNQCIGRDRDLRSEGIKPTAAVMDLELKDWRGRHEWLADGSQVPQQQVIRDWWRARQDSFKVKGRGRPVFKSFRRDLPTLNYTTNGFNVKGDRLALAKGIVFPVVWSRALPSAPSSVRVYRDAVGHWWASFVVRRDREQFPESDRAIGIDWGVKAIATTTDEAFDLPHPAHGRNAAKKLATAQRQMARRRKPRGHVPSKGYAEAKHRTARLYQRVAWARQDGARKWARRTVEVHGALAVEDFKPKFMAANRGLAKRAADAAVGQAKRELLGYAERAGRDVFLIPPAYTTMTCSSCGARAKQRLDLGERTFRCDSCGYVDDRDRNAARTILAAAGLNGACADRGRSEHPDATAA
jgi:putative transposase